MFSRDIFVVDSHLASVSTSHYQFPLLLTSSLGRLKFGPDLCLMCIYSFGY